MTIQTTQDIGEKKLGSGHIVIQPINKYLSTVEADAAFILVPIPSKRPISNNFFSSVSAKTDNLLKLENNDMIASLFKFNLSADALSHNLNLLKTNKFDLEKLLNFSTNSITSYGSEFKDPQLLELLIGNHPRWNKLKQILKGGSNWYMQEIDEDTRRNDLEAALKRGNFPF